MQGEEPATGLVNTFGNKICRVGIFKFIPVFKWEMPLCVRHGTAIKPNIYQVGLTIHAVAG